MRASIIILLVLFLAGCAGPTEEDIRNADYGERPDNPEQIAEEWVEDRLIDPQSAQYDHLEVAKGYAEYTDGFEAKTEYGWLQCGEVNAKNRVGGYTGAEPYFVLIRDNEVMIGEIDYRFATKNCENVVGDATFEGFD